MPTRKPDRRSTSLASERVRPRFVLDPRLESYLPVIRTMTAIDGKTTAYVCQDYTCQLPTIEVERFIELLQS